MHEAFVTGLGNHETRDLPILPNTRSQQAAPTELENGHKKAGRWSMYDYVRCDAPLNEASAAIITNMVCCVKERYFTPGLNLSAHRTLRLGNRLLGAPPLLGVFCSAPIELARLGISNDYPLPFPQRVCCPVATTMIAEKSLGGKTTRLLAIQLLS